MNLCKLTKANLINQLEKRSLPTNGLKDDLIKRLREAMDKERLTEIDNQEENYDSEDEVVEVEDVLGDYDRKDKSGTNDEGSGLCDKVNETLYDDTDIVKDGNTTTMLTVEDTINMKSSSINEAESYSMIVNVDDDDAVMSSMSTKDETMDSEQRSSSDNRGDNGADNGEHEIIEISEEVVIDDEDNQDNDNNFNNEQPFNNEQIQQDKDELENGESRDDDSVVDEEKINLWVHNVAEDVTAIELKELFGKYGKVVSAKIVMDGKNAIGNCFGCVQLCNNEDVDNCIKNLDKSEFRGNLITVSKEVCDASPKEKIQRMISPISSSGSWGGKKQASSVKSLSPPICDTAVDTNDDKDDKGDTGYRPPYRGRGGYRGNNYATKNYSRNDGAESHSKDYRRPSEDTRGNYGSRQDRDEPRPSYRSSNYDSRARDSYPHRESRGGRDGGESRYQPVNRDRPAPRDNYSDRPRSGRDNVDSGRGKYDQDYDRRSYKRPATTYHDKKDDYTSSSKRDDAPYRRPKDDDGYAPKKRREEFTPERRAVSRDKHRSSPKPRETHRGDYRDRRDAGPSERRDAGPRKDYGSRPSTAYSPEGRTSRPSSYNKESYPSDFGGRSRNYDR